MILLLQGAASSGVGDAVGTGAGITSLIVILARIYWESRRERRAVATMERMGNPATETTGVRRRNNASSTDAMVGRMADFNDRLGRLETKIDEHHKDVTDARGQLRRDLGATSQRVAVLWDRSERDRKHKEQGG